jgi:hypothetical protein
MASSRITGTNENISTIGSAGRDYATPTTWEAATDNDLVTGTVSEVGEMYNDSVFTGDVMISGAVTNATYFRILRPANGQGHDGTPNSGVRIDNTTVDTRAVTINENYATVQDLVVKQNFSSASTFTIFRFLATDESSVIGCIVFDSTNSGVGGMYGIRSQAGAGNTAYVINCLVADMDTFGYTQVSGNFFVYNCISVNAGTNFQGVITAKNCIAHGGIADYSATVTTTTCIDEDGTGDITATLVFNDAASDDYHLASSDTAAIDAGTNLSADANFAFDDDIDGDTIPAAEWPIGFDFIAPSGHFSGHTYQYYNQFTMANRTTFTP